MSARPTRIVINALSARTGGGLTYARNLLRHFADAERADIIVLVAPGRKELLPDGPYRIVACDFAGRSVLHRTLWERFVVPRLLQTLEADVYYVLSGTLAAAPPDGCRSVVALRNMLPFDPANRKLYPHGWIRFRLWLIGRAQPWSFANADLVIFVSEYGQQTIDTLLPERRGRSVVIPHGVSEAFLAEQPGAFQERWPEGYVLYVSILDVYKAQIEVVEAWAALLARRETREKLVLAGPEFPPYARRVRQRIAELGLEDEVVLLGPVRHEDGLADLYRGARINLFASHCENCPNILLEAMASGRPVLCSGDPPMPEFGADAVVYFDPAVPAELTERLFELLDDAPRLNSLADAARSRGREYSIERCMRETWKELLALADSESDPNSDPKSDREPQQSR